MSRWMRWIALTMGVTLSVAVPSLGPHGPAALALPGLSPIFSDGFETGDTTRWSNGVGFQCTVCHGGGGNPAPPVDLSGNTETSATGVGAHRKHLLPSTWHKTVGCSECHIVPLFPAAAGHYDSARPAELTWGPLATARGATPSWDGASCFNAYCHSDGWTPSGVMVWTASPTLSCSSCHADQTTISETNMSGEHHKHVSEKGLDCAECHAATVDGAEQIIGPGLHIDGVPQVSLSVGSGWNSGSRTCTLTCHGEEHDSKSWD